MKIKGLWLPLLVVILLWVLIGVCFASDIDVDESQPAITLWKLDTVRFLVFTETCEVYYRKGYMDGDNFISTNKGQIIIFMNVEDNPNTPSDETKTEFTQLINLINSEDNIKDSITKAVKIKLGIE